MSLSHCSVTFTAILIFLLGALDIAVAQRRLAFLVGINVYDEFPTLANPSRDVATLAEALSSIGFDVTTERDVTLASFYTAFARFQSKISPGDTVLVFFAGHGVGFGSGNYLVPKDAPVTDQEQTLQKLSISELDIVEGTRKRGAKLTIVVLDSCRDNPIAALAKKSGKRNISVQGFGLTQPERVEGVVSIYSAGYGQQALDHLGPGDTVANSVFMRVFAKLLLEKVSLGDLIALLQHQVAQLALKAKADDGSAKPHRQEPASYNQTSGGLIFLAGRPENASIVSVERPQAEVRPVSRVEVRALRALILRGFAASA